MPNAWRSVYVLVILGLLIVPAYAQGDDCSGSDCSIPDMPDCSIPDMPDCSIPDMPDCPIPDAPDLPDNQGDVINL